MSDSEPRLRHEFVGMMFAITIGEVGLQVAALVHAGHFLHYLPAYAHLFLATVMIATSWVGWSASRAPGARLDVTAIFQWEFVVLLLDVALVITYFILVRTVEVGKEGTAPRIGTPSTLAFWMLVIFTLYFVWDIVTKIIIYWRDKDKRGAWARKYGSRILPTIVCLILAYAIWQKPESPDLPHYLTADLALLSLVLLFRALKDLVYALIPKEGGGTIESRKIKIASLSTALCALGLILGLLATHYSWPLPISDRIVHEIQTPLSPNSDNP